MLIFSFEKTKIYFSIMILTFSIFFSSSSAANSAPGPVYDDIPVCNLESPILEVCYVSATIDRGGIVYTVGTDFQLSVSDTSSFGGASFSLVVSETGPNYRGGGDFGGATTAAQAGDRANFVVLYPTSLTVGSNLKTAVWAMHNSKDLSYTKEVLNISGTEVLRFTIAFEYFSTWSKLDCDYDDSEFFDFGFLAPNAECELDDSTQVQGVNYSLGFFARGDMELADPILDGGSLSWSGNSISWALNTNAFLFQMVGPRYTNTGARNSGRLKAYFPASAIDYFFGFSFVPGTDLVVSRTDYSPGATITDVLESSDGMTFWERDGGLVVEIASYNYSAPVFSFANPNKNATSPGAGGGSSPGGGGGSGPAPTLPNISASVTPLVLSNPLRVKDSYFKSLDANQLGSISVSQFAKLPVKTLALLTPIQVSALTFDQLKALKPPQVVALKPAVIAVLNSTQIAALQPADFKRMKTTQISRINGAAAVGLAKSDLNSFSRTQLRSLNTKAVKGLKPVVLKSLSVNKLRQFSPRQIRSLTDEQKSALTKTQKKALRIK